MFFQKKSKPTTDDTGKPLIIDVKDAKIYQGDNQILNNVNLELKEGEFAYLIGKTGSGKSSFLKTLYADLPLQEGSGEVAGFDLKKLNRSKISKLRRSLGIVFQDFQLLADRTVYDNLLFVLQATGWKDEKIIELRINEVLNQVELAEKGYKMPHELSGGEQQRVVIARALLNRPKVILADEPTGNLDPDTADVILNLLFKINRELNTAILMATHNYNIIENYAARIIRCADGTLTNEMQIEV